MVGADYLAFRQSYRNSLVHSPKGTTWKNHKYIKKENGRYIYERAKDALSKTGDQIYNRTHDVREGINKVAEDVVDSYWSHLGKVLDSLQGKRLEYELSKPLEWSDLRKYDYNKDTGTIRRREGLSSFYPKTDLTLDEFVLINGEVYKKTAKGNDRSYTKVSK